MSMLAKFLAKAKGGLNLAKDTAEFVGPQLGDKAGSAFRGVGLNRLGDMANEFGFRNPKTMTGAALGGAALGPWAITGAGHGLDAALPHDEEDVPDDVKDYMRQLGVDPKKYEYRGREPGAGAAAGANMGLLASLLMHKPSSSLLKYMAVGGLGGGALGALTKRYSPKNEED